jgi:protein-disulfide isomerase
MSSQPARPLRRERRAATLAQRRQAPRRAASEPRRIGIGLVSLIALAAGLLLIAALVILGNQAKPTVLSVVRATSPAGIPAAGYVLGKADAPVTIDLYEDFQCPACERWGQNVLPSLARNELAAGTVRIAFHSFAFIGPESEAAGRAAWAAGQQGRFWDMWATLYANQGLRENNGAFARDRLVAMADLIGLDHDRFLADVDSAEAAAAVSESSASAVAAGITKTPSLVINGKLFEGAGYTELSTAIAAARG